jgi:amidase
MKTVITGAMVLCSLVLTQNIASAQTFHLQEATIADIHAAIRSGQITCQQLIQLYVNRARAYNGPGTQIVTEKNAPEIFPNYEEFKAAVAATKDLPWGDPKKTVPIEFGRMEPTATDPTVMQQYGMIVGVPNSPKTSSLATINIRGERSITCKGDRDKKEGRPPGTPAVCAELAKLPDALEQAAILDAKYGRNPDLDTLPMYCIAFSFKDPFDTMDMHTTGGADARYDIDFPARDHTLVAQLRKKGAIIYAKSVLAEYNGGGGDPGGKNFEHMDLEGGQYSRSTWAGQPSNPYDTTRMASTGSSSGSAVSVNANLDVCGLCEETRASCRGPANHNSIAVILPFKAMLSFHGGAIGSDVYNDRAGIHCRSIVDAAKVLDALKDPDNGYYDPRDVMTTVPRSYFSKEPYSTAAITGTPGALKGMRIGIVREFMVKWTKADEPIVDAVNAQMKDVIGSNWARRWWNR